MRILFISNLFPPVVLGGYELGCANVAQGLADKGHEVEVLTTWSHLPVAQGSSSVKVLRELDMHWHIPLKSEPPVLHERDLHDAVCSTYINTQRVLDSIRRFKPDVVYAWNLIGIGAAAILDLLNLVRVPWAIHLMDRVPQEIVGNVSAPILGLFDAQGHSLYKNARVISMSQHLLDEIKSLSGILFSDKVDILPGAVDLSAAIPHEPYLKDGRARFVTAGAVLPHKGIDLIVQACAQLKAEGLDFVVDVFGDGDVPRYVDMAHSLQVAEQVRFLGSRSQPELLRLYAGYDAFLFPTWEREPFGFAPVEAAGCGTVPIMTMNCGASERVVDGVHCLKIERTVDDLAQTMGRVARGEIDLARIGRAGRRLVSTDLSMSRCIRDIEAILTRHAAPWDVAHADDPHLPLLTFLKHNLSTGLRFA